MWRTLARARLASALTARRTRLVPLAAALALAGCATTADAPSGGLAGTAWRLIHFGASDDAIGTVVPPRIERYTLRFSPDGALAAQLDCNRAMGRWQAAPSSTSGGSLKISAAAMTRAFCGQGALDTRIAADFERVRSYTIAGGNLSLALEADAGIYLWAPAADLGP